MNIAKIGLYTEEQFIPTPSQIPATPILLNPIKKEVHAYDSV